MLAPKYNSPPSYIGHVDTFENGVVRGWACNNASPDQTVTVRVLCNGQEICAVAADQFRQDLYDAGVGNRSGCYMFRVVVQGSLTGLTSHPLHFFADGLQELAGSPVRIVEPSGALYRLSASPPPEFFQNRLEILPPSGGTDERLPVNSGLAVLNKSCMQPGPRTIIVIGHARSGTSMIARALHIAGLPMGLPVPPLSNYEDKELVEVFQRASERPPLDAARLDQLIELRNTRHPNWGFKAPGALQSLPYLLRHTRNPRIVVVFRDTLATSLRERLAVDADLWESFESVLAYEALLLTFLRNTDVPCLLVSYEKALLEPRCFCDHLASFAALDADPAWIERAVLEMNPSQRDYVEGVREVKYSLSRSLI